MSYKTIITTAVFASIAMSPAMAQDITGASVSGIFVSIDDDNATTFEGGAEVALGGGFAAGANVGLYNGRDFDDSGFNGTLHGMYMLSPNSALGVFVARDSVDDIDADSYGVEVGFGSSNGRFEFYYGGFDDGTDIDQSISGLSFEFGIADNFALTFDYDALTLSSGSDDAAIGAGAFGARYQFEAGPSIYAEVGSVAVAASNGNVTVAATESEFVGIGAEYNFGRGGGNLMSNRTVFDALGF